MYARQFFSLTSLMRLYDFTNEQWAQFTLTSLNVDGSLHKVYNAPLANVLLGSIYFDKFSLLTLQTKKF